MTVRFDAALRAAQETATELVEKTALRTVVLRDVIGRVSLVIDDRVRQFDDDIDALGARLTAGAGRFSSPSPVLLASDMFAPDGVFADRSVIWSVEHEGLGLLERGVVGTEWAQVGSTPLPGRVAMYGFKGGVGRSTATFMLARHLAAQGRCVLVVDLDLESPGVGPLLEDQDRFPPHGLVDQLVESAVGNEADLEVVARSTRIREAGNGEVWLAPSGGAPREGYDYLAKLNRVYTGVPLSSGGQSSFAERLAAAVEACEQQVASHGRAPEVVLLDARAGLHDIAAVALTQLADLCLLFAADNRQTWSGYRMLFEQWRTAGVATIMRDRLKMVAALTPANAAEYLSTFSDRAQAHFAELLYDDAAAGDTEAYNPAPGDRDAPHSPIPIRFVSELVGLDSDHDANWYATAQIETAYHDFLNEATSLILGDADE